MLVLIAPDKFKGNLSASQVASAVAAGIHAVQPDAECVEVPMADGGDGTVDAFIAAGWRSELVDCVDALGREKSAAVARRASTVVVELANICGIAGLGDERAPWDASTRGLGIALRAVIDEGAEHVIVALGGSASTDGGAGLLRGLGFVLADESGDEVADGLRGLADVASLATPPDAERLRSLRWTLLCDVDSPLVGPTGAAYSFGPQKGLRGEELAESDVFLARWADVLEDFSGRSVHTRVHAGAAGGAAAALIAVFDAEVSFGAQFIADAVGLREQVVAADLVVTGEGRFDGMSSLGKAPGLVLDLASKYGVPSVVITGSVSHDAPSATAERVITLAQMSRDGEDTFADAAVLLQRAGEQIGTDLADLCGD